MKLFIDSSQKVFAAALMDDNYKVLDSEILKTKFKVESIVGFLKKQKNIQQIDEIYVNIGPGSFTGSRSSLLYIRTLAQINSKIKIFQTTTFNILKAQSRWVIFKRKKMFIEATKTKSYCWVNEEIKLVEKSKKEKEINYKHLINHFANYKNIFQEISVDQLKPLYASNPQIGAQKSWKF